MASNNIFIMRTLSSISLAIVFLALNQLTNALAHDSSLAEPNYSKSYRSCMDKAEGVTIEMRSCIGRELSIQDNRLNRNYKRYFESVEGHVKKKLRTAQQAWIQFRNKECELAGSLEEGKTLEPILIGSCYLDMTARRADELE
ncbi:lysozyme inhibitor LprI family protein [Noviherbaspirillum saxi]|uniref:DUF1311 domain-containing protein n=1 Tax=Noviherbaspirillum saxi TaxID=2320863 RepID=A0A3A3FV46_9BURK|nr:lysozyme inhibitor LprI family protein [Noviherbaspirillum saxi]RJF99470.1 DUF1311 domain-containing protein [Noviherbaspirillum saxi]